MDFNQSLSDILRNQAEKTPYKKAYTFVSEGMDVESLTYARLFQIASGHAEAIHSLAEKTGIILLFPSGMDYIRAFWSTLVAGKTAIPLPLPATLTNNPPFYAQIRNIARLIDHAVIITTAAIRDQINENLHEFSIFTLDELAITPGSNASGTPGAACYLFTSGSVSAPKGVILTRENLIQNGLGVISALNYAPESVTVSWLPHFHAFGMLVNFIYPTLSGSEAVLFSASDFAANPLIWPELLSAYKATHTGSPNFGYDLTAREGRHKQVNLDLSRLSTAFSAGEPVNYETYSRFLSTFQHYGLRKDFLKPMYGMSESGTICVHHEGVPSGLPLDLSKLSEGKIEPATVTTPQKIITGCGKPIAGTRIMIINPENNLEAQENEIGEICISGPSLFQRYLSEEHNEGAFININGWRYFKTGDLGFFKTGELFVTGRSKEIIIVNGKNHYPADIEVSLSESHAALRDTAKAVFSIDRGDTNEHVIAVIESPPAVGDSESLATLAASAVLIRNGIKLDEILFTLPGSIPRTGSGKLQRNACKQAFLQNKLSVIFRKDVSRIPHTAVDEKELEKDSAYMELRALFQELFPKQAPILSLLEFDSIALIRITRRVNQHFNTNLQLAEIIACETLPKLSTTLAQRKVTGREKHKTTENRVLTEGTLSINQLGLWIDYERNKHTFRYNTPLAFKLKRETELKYLEQAIASIQDLFPILRARFSELDTKPVLTIAEKKVPLLITTTTEGSAIGYLRKKAWIPYSLDDFSPLFTAEAVIDENNDKTLFINGSHLIFDGMSCQIFLRELQALYQDLVTRGKVSREQREYAYFDFANWESNYLSSIDRQDLQRIWTQKKGIFEGLNLPYDFTSTSEASPGIFVESVPVNIEKRINEEAKKLKISKYSLMLAVYFIVLHRYTRQGKITVGTAFLNRPEEKFEDALGYFSNMLPFFTEVDPAQSFEKFVAIISAETTALLSTQSIPFPEIINIIRSQSTEEDTLAFQTCFLFQDWKIHNAQHNLLEEQYYEINQATIGDLTLEVLSTESGLKLLAKYNAKKFKESTIRALVDSYIEILDKSTRKPDAEISELLHLTKHEERLLDQWNQNHQALPEIDNLISIFSGIAGKFADKPAVVTGNMILTYKELDRQIQSLAQTLAGKGIRKGSRIGLLLPRNQTIPIAMFACFYLSATYIPLDPDLPESRLRYILEHSKPDILLSSSNLKKSYENLPLIAIEDLLSESSNTPLTPGSYASQDPVYIIYTSGSTGKPKGVAVAFEGLLNYHLTIAKHAGIQADDTMLAVSTISFDIAVTEIIVPLLSGSTVYIANENDQKSGEDLNALIEQRKVSLLQGTPTTFKLLLKAGWDRSTCLKKVFTTGEAIPAELAGKILKTGVELWNMYGPTEATIEATISQITDPGDISIGKPIDNIRLYILDEHLNRVPPGAVGELHIAGVCLANGYLDQPELTSEKFIPINTPSIPEQRLYKTGDLTRFSLDGALYYLGRNDHQIKIRGYRIELKEIEHALKTYPDIADCCVATVKSAAGVDELKALIIPRHVNKGLILDDLRAYLKNILPAYMIPGSFYSREAMPLLPNGKIDRHRLFTDGEDIKPLVTQSVSVMNETETTIASIWEKTLGKPALSTDRTFFDEGGNSLLIPELQMYFKLHFPDLTIRLAHFFQFTTIASQAEWIKSERKYTSGTASSQVTNSDLKEDHNSIQIVEAPARQSLRATFRTTQL